MLSLFKKKFMAVFIVIYILITLVMQVGKIFYGKNDPIFGSQYPISSILQYRFIYDTLWHFFEIYG